MQTWLGCVSQDPVNVKFMKKLWGVFLWEEKEEEEKNKNTTQLLDRNWNFCFQISNFLCKWILNLFYLLFAYCLLLCWIPVHFCPSLLWQVKDSQRWRTGLPGVEIWNPSSTVAPGFSSAVSLYHVVEALSLTATRLRCGTQLNPLFTSCDLVELLWLLWPTAHRRVPLSGKREEEKKVENLFF